MVEEIDRELAERNEGYVRLLMLAAAAVFSWLMLGAAILAGSGWRQRRYGPR